jgi:hypothetical protein
MMCFIKERYGRGLESGGMLAFVFDGDIEKARSSVGESILSKQQQLKCSPVVQFSPSSILNNAVEISESSHSLPNRTFRIYHAFLAV